MAVVPVVSNQTSPEWTLSAGISLFSGLAGFLTNGLVLYCFATVPALRSPFDMYLISLVIANIIIVTLQVPFDVYYAVYNSAWHLSESVCKLYLYVGNVIQAVSSNTHLLIALNRVWAVASPLSYRTHHSVRTAIGQCVGVWVIFLAAGLPYVVLDALYYRVQDNCYVSGAEASQLIYGHIVQGVFFDVPQVHRASLPIVLGMKLKNRRIMQRTVRIMDPVIARRGQVRPARARGYATELFVLLTLCLMVCWTPINTYYTLARIIPEFEAGHVLFLTVATSLFSLQIAIDPLIFILAMPALREEVKKKLLFCHRLC